MADKKSREVIGVERDGNDYDWGLYAFTSDGKEFAISSQEFLRLKSVILDGDESHPILDESQVLFERDALDVKTGYTDGDISIKITAEVDEALAGFKALQRELRDTTKAARELESAYAGINELLKEGERILELIDAEISKDDVSAEFKSAAVETLSYYKDALDSLLQGSS